MLVIADGAAFEPEMGEVYLRARTHPELWLYLPASFEWLVWFSGLIDGRRVREFLAKRKVHVEIARFFGWEQY